MARQRDVAACGGFAEAVLESEMPEWFPVFAECFAVGDQDEPGDITWTRGFVRGAGLVLRKSAWEQLAAHGFRSLLVGRLGDTLTSGNDCELGYALRLAGWWLVYDPGLRLRHVIAAHRLRWDYLRRLTRANGASSVAFGAYFSARN